MRYFFSGNYRVNIPDIEILSVKALENIQITGFSGDIIYNYTLNSTMVPDETGSYIWNMSGEEIYFNSVNGINYLMKYGNLYLKPYGYTYYNLSYLTNNIFENNGKIYELIHRQLLNSGINANNSKISMSGNAIN